MRPPPQPPTSFLHASRLPFSPSTDDDSSLGVEDSLRAGPSSRPTLPSYAFASTPSAPGTQASRMQHGPPPQSHTPIMQTPQGMGMSGQYAPPQLVRNPAIAPPPPNAPRFAPAPLPVPTTMFAVGPASSRTMLLSPDSAVADPSFSFGPAHARPAVPVRGLWHAMAPPPLPPPATTNLEAAAIAAERRIQHLRATAAARTPDPSAVMGPARRVVSFSTATTTPSNHAGSRIHHGAPPPPPPQRPHPGRGGASVDASTSHLHARGGANLNAGYDEDLSFSLSPPAPTAAPTRLFAQAPLPPSKPTEASFTSESQSASASVLPPDNEIQTVTLRKWDGSTATIPSYLVSDTPEAAVEETFDHDTTTLFDVKSLVASHTSSISGTNSGSSEEKGVDALKGILEVQLGLRGSHGWYGHTYRNPKPETPRGSLKRRRSSSASASTTVDQNEEDPAPIVVYDSFGRVKGTIMLPDYASRGGPSFPLPLPVECLALRNAANSTTVLRAGSKLEAKEARLNDEIELVKERYDSLQANSRDGKDNRSTIKSAAFYRELSTRHQALTSFRTKHRDALKKGLQNALLDSVLFTR